MERWIVTNLCAVSDTDGITSDQKGNIYFTRGKEGVWKLDTTDAQAKPELIAKPKFDLGAVVSDGNNSLYVCNRLENKIYRCDLQNRKFIHVAGTLKQGYKDGKAKWAKFIKPSGITMDHNGDLLVTDSHHIRRINMKENTVETIAGWNDNENCVGSNDGTTEEASFNYPCGITVDVEGVIYVCDKGNHKIRKIQDGIVSTLSSPITPTGSKCLFQDCIVNDGFLIAVDGTSLLKVDLASGDVLAGTFPEVKGWARCLAKGRRGEIYVGTSRYIVKMEDPWNYERFLWLGRLKEDKKYCYLASLPKEITKEIACYLHPVQDRISCGYCQGTDIQENVYGDRICCDCGCVLRKIPAKRPAKSFLEQNKKRQK